MKPHRLYLPVALFWLIAGAGAAKAAGPTGLNTIPTTDIVPLQSWIGQVQNGNTSLSFPAFFNAPGLLVQSQFALSSHAEAGIDWATPPDLSQPTVVANWKELLLSEDDRRPNLAVGVWNVANHQAPGYYLTLSKTLNYAQQQRERFRAHHRRNRKLLGRRLHAGLMLGGHGDLEPFLGTDLQLNEQSVFQADWINGSGNAITAGIAYVMPDQRTVINPALLFSNRRHRLDGFFLNISHDFSL